MKKTLQQLTQEGIEWSKELQELKKKPPPIEIDIPMQCSEMGEVVEDDAKSDGEDEKKKPPDDHTVLSEISMDDIQKVMHPSPTTNKKDGFASVYRTPKRFYSYEAKTPAEANSLAQASASSYKVKVEADASAYKVKQEAKPDGEVKTNPVVVAAGADATVKVADADVKVIKAKAEAADSRD